MKGHGKRLVVDADVACSAGPDPKCRPWSERAKDSHDVLHAIFTRDGHKVVFDATLYKEWKKHAGKTATGWLTKMTDRGRVDQVVSLNDTWVITEIENLPKSDRKVALKDRHLVVLACDHGDRCLLSEDGKAREKYQRLDDGRIKTLHWVPPSPEAKQWLLDGAPNRQEWTLGHQAECA